LNGGLMSYGTNFVAVLRLTALISTLNVMQKTVESRVPSNSHYRSPSSSDASEPRTMEPTKHPGINNSPVTELRLGIAVGLETGSNANDYDSLQHTRSGRLIRIALGL
jgi:hypothetical protein